MFHSGCRKERTLVGIYPLAHRLFRALIPPASSKIIQELNGLHSYGLASLAFFYCDYKDGEKSDFRGLLSSLICQLCDQSDSYCHIFFNFYLGRTCGPKHSRDDALVQCLKDLLKVPGQPPVYLILDALDECPNTSDMSSPRKNVLNLVKELTNSLIPNLRICVTSRPEDDIVFVLSPLTFRSVTLHRESGQKMDIDNYIRSVINTDPKCRRWRAEYKQLVVDGLTKNTDGK